MHHFVPVLLGRFASSVLKAVGTIVDRGIVPYARSLHTLLLAGPVDASQTELARGIDVACAGVDGVSRVASLARSSSWYRALGTRRATIARAFTRMGTCGTFQLARARAGARR